MSELIFGKYEIIRRLALGGMGEVFLARERSEVVDRLIILKSLLPELAEQEGFIEQFLDEARVAAKLNHPNVVGIHEVGCWQGVYFIAMEHILGGDLAKLQRAAGKKNVGLPFQVSARIIRDAALGLHHAHTKSDDVTGQTLDIVHRDISPQNIMVRRDGVTKVVDFGIAIASNRETRTKTGLLKGKLQYMPPEQVRGDDLDGRSDQFSLGVVLWEMCTGRRLFKAENELETLKKVLNNPIPPPSQFVGGFPEGLESVIMRMLERDPKDRFANCEAAANALTRYLDTCSLQIGEQQVAKFVTEILGDELNERTRNLQPSQDNFILSFDQSGPNQLPVDQPTPTANFTSIYQRRRSRAVAATVGLSLILALGMGLFFFSDLLFGTGDEVSQTLPGAPGETVEIGEPKLVKGPSRVERIELDGKIAFRIESPKGASIRVDGKLWEERAPTVITGLNAGDHKIEVLEKDQVIESSDVELEAMPAILKIESTPAGAMVWLEDTPLGKTPLTRDNLPLGERLNLRVSKRGYESEGVPLVLKAGTKVSKVIKLEKKKKKSRKRLTIESTPTPTPTPAPKNAAKDGFLTINSSPWSKVTIDDQPYGSTPIFKVRLSPKTHTIILENEDLGVRLVKKVKILPGKTIRRQWTLKK